jgi:hypothetical protein
MKKRCYALIQSSLIKDTLQSIFPGIETKIIFRYLLVIAAYVVLTVLLTYPVAFTLGTHIPGLGDAFQWMNTLWLTYFAVAHPDITSLTHNNMIFFPTGIPWMPFPSAFNQLLTLLLIPIFQIQVIYSLIWLLTFVLAALGAFALVRYLTQNDYAAFISGIIFAFTPYHFAHGMGHISAITIQWIPFCALFFMKVYREGGLKNCFFAAFFYILVAMSDLQYMVYTGLFIIILFLYEHFLCLQNNKKLITECHKSIFIKYLIIGVVAFSVIVPLMMNEINVATSENNFLIPNQTDINYYSTNLQSFFIPSIYHPVFGDITLPIFRKYPGGGNFAETTTYIGYSVLILSIFAVYILRKDRTVRFWAIIALLFSLFSLGPVLHVGNKTGIPFFNVSPPMPYVLLQYIVPFIENSRTPGRLFIIAALAFSVLAGYGCSELLKRYNSRKAIILFLISAIIIFEYLTVPVMITPVDQPDFYKKIGSDPEQYALMEIPITANYTAGVEIIYYQTIHGKPVVGGQAARAPGDVGDFERTIPFIEGITFLKPVSPDIINHNLSETGNSILSHYNIRYVILHVNSLTDDQLNIVNNTLSSSLGQPTIYPGDSLIVYEVKNETVDNFIMLNEGWYPAENWSGTAGRWITSNATLSIFSDEDRHATFTMQVLSFNQSRNLAISFPDQQQKQINVSTDFINVTVPTDLRKGENIIRFNTPEGCLKPSDIPELNTSDKRCLSVAVQNLSIS